MSDVEKKVCEHVLDSGGEEGSCGECFGIVVARLAAAEARAERMEEALREAETLIARHDWADERAALGRLRAALDANGRKG